MIQDMIREKYGWEASRLYRILMDKRILDEKGVRQVSFLVYFAAVKDCVDDAK
jgi:hypothetical protein